MSTLAIDKKVKRLMTDTRREPRKLLFIEGTRYQLAVPFSIPMNRWFEYRFELGGITFEVVRLYADYYALRPDRPLPASWLIEL